MSSHSSRFRWMERALVAIGLWCLAWVGLESLQAASFRRQLQETALARGASPALVGRLEIPRLGFSHVVAEGDGKSTLRAAIGHVPETALPWHPGNSALAGHRDSVFRPLRDIRIGDEIRLITPHGDFDYHVTQTLVVNPEAIWVLAPTRARTLTLVTCYPFSFIGLAPKRFVVRAEAGKAAVAVARDVSPALRLPAPQRPALKSRAEKSRAAKSRAAKSRGPKSHARR